MGGVLKSLLDVLPISMGEVELTVRAGFDVVRHDPSYIITQGLNGDFDRVSESLMRWAKPETD